MEFSRQEYWSGVPLPFPPEKLLLLLLLSRFSRVQLFATLWTVARQAPLSMGFSRQEYLSGLPFLPSGDVPKPGIEPMTPASQVDSFKLAFKLAAEPNLSPCFTNKH